MSNPSNPSAGTARPDAAPSEYARTLVTNHEQVAMAVDVLGVTEVGDAEERVLAYIGLLEKTVNDSRVGLAKWEQECAALRSALAERETECERLRASKARLGWLESRLSNDPDFELTGQPDPRWPRFVLTNHPESAGVQGETLEEAIDAAKARWPDVASAAVAPAPTEDDK